MNFAITKEEAELIGNYLANRPFCEVEGLINILRRLRPITFEDSKQSND